MYTTKIDNVLEIQFLFLKCATYFMKLRAEKTSDLHYERFIPTQPNTSEHKKKDIFDHSKKKTFFC